MYIYWGFWNFVSKTMQSQSVEFHPLHICSVMYCHAFLATLKLKTEQHGEQQSKISWLRVSRLIFDHSQWSLIWTLENQLRKANLSHDVTDVEQAAGWCEPHLWPWQHTVSSSLVKCAPSRASLGDVNHNSVLAEPNRCFLSGGRLEQIHFIVSISADKRLILKGFRLYVCLFFSSEQSNSGCWRTAMAAFTQCITFSGAIRS